MYCKVPKQVPAEGPILALCSSGLGCWLPDRHVGKVSLDQMWGKNKAGGSCGASAVSILSGQGGEHAKVNVRVPRLGCLPQVDALRCAERIPKGMHPHDLVLASRGCLPACPTLSCGEDNFSSAGSSPNDPATEPLHSTPQY